MSVKCLAARGIDERLAIRLAQSFAVRNIKNLLQASTVDFGVTGSEVLHPSPSKEDGTSGPSACHLLYARLRNDQDSYWILSFSRHHKDLPFQNCDIALLRNILPMAERLLSEAMKADVAEADPPSWQILNELHLGVILTSVDGHVTVANRAARWMLKSGQLLQLVNGRIAARGAANNSRFQKALRETRSSCQGAGRATVIGSDDSQSAFLIHFMRLGGSTGLSGPREPTLAVLISDTSELCTIDSDSLHEMYGLTPLEAEIASKICAGLNPKETAIKLGITPNTVRSYLKSIFRKMGVHRQADLIRIMAYDPLKRDS